MSVTATPVKKWTTAEMELGKFTPKTAVRPGEVGKNDTPINTSLLTTPKPTAQQQHANLVQQAEKLVAGTFFGTLLKQMRNSPFKDELFSGGRGGEAFGSLYDQHLAEHMAHASGRRLAASVVKHIERKTKPNSKTAAEAAPTTLPEAKRTQREASHVSTPYRP